MSTHNKRQHMFKVGDNVVVGDLRGKANCLERYVGRTGTVRKVLRAEGTVRYLVAFGGPACYFWENELQPGEAFGEATS